MKQFTPIHSESMLSDSSRYSTENTQVYQRNSNHRNQTSRRPAENTPLDRLYFYHELDEWQKDNHYIKSGYVRETSSYRKCLNSLAYLHNETVNIYSHLVPAILVVSFVILLLSNKIMLIESTSFLERLNFIQFCLAAITCLSLSAMFHLFKSHSHVVCKFGNQCDYFGIVVMITSSLISIMMFAFRETVAWRNGFIALFVVLGGICTKVTFDSKFSTPAYRPFRSLMFILFGLSGALPVIAAVKLFGVEDAIKRSNATWLVMEGILYILGAVLYAARFPERLTHVESEDTYGVAGLFDHFGHSHQIFHFAVVIAAYCHWRALVGCYFDMKLRAEK